MKQKHKNRGFETIFADDHFMDYYNMQRCKHAVVFTEAILIMLNDE